MSDPVHPAITEAEEEIQDILLDLVNRHGLNIDHVYVDTRRFANYRVEIFEVAPAISPHQQDNEP